MGFFRPLRILNNKLLFYNTQLNKIQEITGDLNIISGFHDFKKAKFLMPTECNICKKSIWGISAHGYACKQCKYYCHIKCKSKVPPSCTRDGIDNDQLNEFQI